MRNTPASSAFSSTLTFARMKSPWRSSASRSSTGPMTRQGPHHAAQKSTTTGVWRDRSRTSFSKFASPTSIVHWFMDLLPASAVLRIVGDDLAREVPHLGGDGPERVHRRLPDLVLGRAGLARALEMQFGAVLVIDREIHREADELRHLLIQRAFLIFDPHELNRLGHLNVAPFR